VIKHLIWDLDGTLFDTYPAITQAFLDALADWDHYPDPDFIMGLALTSLTESMVYLSETYNLPQEKFEEGFQNHYNRIPYTEQPLYPGVHALCAYVRSLGGKNVIVTHRPRGSASALLEVYDLNPLIEDFITGDDDFPKKPDPTSMLAIMSRNKIDNTQALAIGDRELDIAAGQAAGLRTCLFGQGDIQSQPDFQVDHYDKLLEIIQTENHTGTDG
jgi:HAD superfamily hydrolase (TIGR01549 family)